MFVEITLLIFTSVILIKINLKLFIIFLISCLSYLIILVLNNKKQKNLIEINQESNSIKNTYLSENINCIDTIKNMNISKIINNFDFSEYNSLNIHYHCKFMFEIENAYEIYVLLYLFNEFNIDYYVIGNGSKILFKNNVINKPKCGEC